MTRDNTKALIEALHALWNDGDLSAVGDVYSPDFVVHWSRSAEIPDSHGHEGVTEAIRKTRVGFPDWHESVVDVIIEGDRAVTRYVSTGTHLGPYDGLQPTGARVEIEEISIFRIAGGKVAEQWCLVDDLTFMAQLGQS
jgi:predicted ester cyclase